MCSKSGEYFVIILLLVFFLILYISFDPYAYMAKEKYESKSYKYADANISQEINDVSLPVFLKPHTGEVYQGMSIPLKYKPSKKDEDELLHDDTKPTVDGTKDGPRSMYMFAYNKCSPECCIDSPYSCSGGCVCMTDNQINYLDKRGNNREPNQCFFEGK